MRLSLLIAALLTVLVAASARQPAGAAPGDPVAAARQRLREVAAQFGWRPDLADLQPVAVREGLAASYVRFQQTAGGVPVVGGSVTVAVPHRAGQAAAVTSRYHRDVWPQPVVVAAGAGDGAVLTALGALGSSSSRLRGEPSVQQAYVPFGREHLLVWRVVLPLREPLGSWLVDVRADTGEVLAQTNLLRFDSGRVFDPNPPKTSGGTIPPPRDCDSAGNESLLAGQYRTKTLLGIAPLQNRLKGEFVDLTAPGIVGGYKPAGLANESSRSYVYPCINDRFEEVMVYYHVDAVQRKIQSLGYAGGSGIFDRPIPAHAHYFNDCNAFYDPVDRGLHFGDGDVCTFTTDAAEDGDVIVHEYGHAIQDDQIPAFGFGPGAVAEQAWAMGEGFSDFLAAAVFGDSCLGEWLSFGGSCLRNVENPNHYPEDFNACRTSPPLPAEPHCAGLIWGGALWDLAQALGNDQRGRDLALTLALEGHFMMDPLSTFAEAAAAIRQADSLLYGGAHVATIDGVFSARGISSLGSVSDFPYAYLRIRHPFPDDLDIQLTVGSTSSPVCVHNVWDPNTTPPFSSPDLVGYEDLSTSACISGLPPTPAQPWFLEVRDVFPADVGTLEEFEVVLNGSQRCVATDVPMAIPDAGGFVYSMVNCGTVVSGTPVDGDGDGFDNAAETYIGTDPLLRCGNTGWPVDLISSGLSANKLDVQDLASYIAPLRRINQSPGDPNFSVRWDLKPGAGPLPKAISIQDMTVLVTLAPPMLAGQRAFNMSCP